jgi:hypothetical protein
MGGGTWKKACRFWPQGKLQRGSGKCGKAWPWVRGSKETKQFLKRKASVNSRKLKKLYKETKA